MTSPPALLLIGHGTRDDEEAEAFRSLVRTLGERNPGLPVGGGFAELSTPSLDDAVEELMARHGARRFVAVPLALGAAGQATGGAPAALSQAAPRHPGTSYLYAPLGCRPALLEALERRLDNVLGDGRRSPSDRAATTVLLVGRGSTDPGGNAEVDRAARLLWEGRGYAGVETAFVSLAAPDVPLGLDRCLRLGAKRVVVLPYFLFTGALPDRVRQQAEGWAEAHPQIDVRYADVIGRAPELADLVMERYREALAGGLRMNCDSCGYVIGRPGPDERTPPSHHRPEDPAHSRGHHHDGHAHSH
ncbi:sirohydrochlorin chelatase [Streptantibioticus ferralitis]|uniref:Sirohydrochlorin chelatase n=1 Tax=Streptantibioticus ferralitis TaxID=236510 RepID=A0ABT5Z1G8_9ACTN|nr:sirohydrochlorin chelatase [Streptantibioticus ferralitis]MDF2256905.1 sirohydrochlorin chelatase [Streptantibioticus ferralitis]